MKKSTIILKTVKLIFLHLENGINQVLELKLVADIYEEELNIKYPGYNNSAFDMELNLVDKSPDTRRPRG